MKKGVNLVRKPSDSPVSFILMASDVTGKLFDQVFPGNIDVLVGSTATA